MCDLTVFIPTYNRSKYLRQAIDSVLSQSFRDFSLVVVDNASDDETAKICQDVQDPRFSWHRNDQNLGMRGNWQKCLDLCDTRWFSMLEDDNIWEPTFLEETYRPDDEYVLMHSGAWVFSDDEKIQYERKTFWWRTDGVMEQALEPYETCMWQSLCSQIAASTAIFDVHVAREAGGYPPDFTAAQDWLLISRVSRLGKTLSINRPLIRYRVHSMRASEDAIVSARVRYEKQQIASDNLAWSLSQAGLTHDKLWNIVSRAPVGHLYGLIKAVAVFSTDLRSHKFARELWDYLEKLTLESRPRLVQYARPFGFYATCFLWKLANKVT